MKISEMKLGTVVEVSDPYTTYKIKSRRGVIVRHHHHGSRYTYVLFDGCSTLYLYYHQRLAVVCANPMNERDWVFVFDKAYRINPRSF